MKTAKIGAKVRIKGNSKRGFDINGKVGIIVSDDHNGWVNVEILPPDTLYGKIYTVHLSQLREIKKVPKQCPKCKDLKERLAKAWDESGDAIGTSEQAGFLDFIKDLGLE